MRAESQAGRRGFVVVVDSGGQVERLFDLLDARAILLTFATLRRAVDWCHPLLRPRALRQVRV